jgi:dipeptidyl aminopeptidase/acylaminoacyl peptidase
MPKIAWFVFVLLGSVSVPTMAASSESPRDARVPALLDALRETRSIPAVALSPDGRKLAWVVKTGGKPAIQIADADGSHAHDVGSAKPGQCTQGDIAWSPDSRQLAFLSDCDGARQTGMHTVAFVVGSEPGAMPRRLRALQGYAQALHWSPDGKVLGLLYTESATRRASAEAAANAMTGEIGVDAMEIQRVVTLDTTNGELRYLTSLDQYAYEFAWSPDGRRLAYIAARPPGDNNWWKARLYVKDTEGDGAPKAIVDPATVGGSLHGLQIALPRWSPDGSTIAFIGGLMSDRGQNGGDIYSVASEGGEAVNLTPGIDVTPAWLSWTGPHALLVAQVARGQSQLAEYGISNGKATRQRVRFSVPASIGDGTATMAMSLSGDRRQLAYVADSYSQAPEVHAGALADKPPPAVTAFNASMKPSWGKTESVEWTNEGSHVQGWLLYPAGYDPKKTYPMVVAVHGGPSYANIPRWGSGIGEVILASTGHFVFMPNPRGSFGQGEAFVQANRKDFGHGDLRDILAGVDAVEKKVPVDDDRLGLLGWSYGGYMAMFSVTQTQRFHAAVAGAGISNWQSYYGENLIDQWMTPFFGASVYDDPAVYAKSSPINFVKQVKTPTLIMVGDRDAECPAPQSFEFWHALRAQHVTTSLVVYPGEGHQFSDPAHWTDLVAREVGWFGKYLSTR